MQNGFHIYNCHEIKPEKKTECMCVLCWGDEFIFLLSTGYKIDNLDIIAEITSAACEDTTNFPSDSFSETDHGVRDGSMKLSMNFTNCLGCSNGKFREIFVAMATVLLESSRLAWGCLCDLLWYFYLLVDAYVHSHIKVHQNISRQKILRLELGRCC